MEAIKHQGTVIHNLALGEVCIFVFYEADSERKRFFGIYSPRINNFVGTTTYNGLEDVAEESPSMLFVRIEEEDFKGDGDNHHVLDKYLDAGHELKRKAGL